MTEDPTTVYVEVTNTLAAPHITGYQRHTREILRHLATHQHLKVTPVVWDAGLRDFRLLTGPERTRLASFRSPQPPEVSRLRRLANRLPTQVQSIAARLAHSRFPAAIRQRFAGLRRARAVTAEQRELRWQPEPGSWWFDLEAAWHNPRHRNELLPELQRSGLRLATLVADLMPYTHPHWFDSQQRQIFADFMDAHLEHSKLFVCISHNTLRDLEDHLRTVGRATGFRHAVVYLGADFVNPKQALDPPAIASPFALTVGTVEPRKNHAFALDAFETLWSRGEQLSWVIVGKPGWMTDSIQHRIRHHPEYQRLLHWPDRVGDHELAALYTHAFLCIQPSLYEGWGSPVIEGLAYGVPTLASPAGAQVEAGGELAEYFDPADADELVNLIARHLHDPAHHEARLARVRDFTPQSWADCAEGIATALLNATD